MKAAAGGCSIGVRVKPRASKEKIVSFDEREVCVAVKAPPVEGKANEAVVRLLADILGVSRSSIVVRRGAASRHKLVQVSCMQKDEVMKKLREAV